MRPPREDEATGRVEQHGEVHSTASVASKDHSAPVSPRGRTRSKSKATKRENAEKDEGKRDVSEGKGGKGAERHQNVARPAKAGAEKNDGKRNGEEMAKIRNGSGNKRVQQNRRRSTKGQGKGGKALIASDRAPAGCPPLSRATARAGVGGSGSFLSTASAPAGKPGRKGRGSGGRPRQQPPGRSPADRRRLPCVRHPTPGMPQSSPQHPSSPRPAASGRAPHHHPYPAPPPPALV